MILNLEEAKRETVNFLNKKSFSLVRPEFNKYDPIYQFSTENLQYLEKIKGSKVLAVTGSFDQALNLVYEGSSEIDNYDVNVLTVYYAGLKYAAMKCLTYQEYLAFFAGDNLLDYDTYSRLRPYLHQTLMNYWDFIYELFNKDNNAIKNSRLFQNSGTIGQIIGSNPYLKDEKAYNKTKNQLDNVKINFLEKNLTELSDDKKYDLILTSNIETYLVEDYFAPLTEEEYVDFVKNKLSKLLNRFGIIQIAYQYYYKTPLKVNKKINLFKKYRISKIDYLEGFKKIEIDSRPLSSLAKMDGEEKDCIYYYKQK